MKATTILTILIVAAMILGFSWVVVVFLLGLIVGLFSVLVLARFLALSVGRFIRADVWLCRRRSAR